MTIRLALLLLLTALASEATAQSTTGPGPREIKAVPVIDWGWEMLPVREYAQRLTLNRFEVFYDFQFRNTQPESGITFENQITPDSALFYQPNHYDHGNGVAVADVDGDGRYDIYFSTQLGRNELWRNLGGGSFENITERPAWRWPTGSRWPASFGDIDNDGDPDLFVTTVRMGNVLFENDGSGRFRDITREAGVDYVGHSSGAVFFDYDRDGLLDLFVTNVGVYTTDRAGPRRLLTVGMRRRLLAATSSRSAPSTASSTATSANGVRRRLRRRGLRRRSWSGDATLRRLQRRRLPGSLRPQHAGRRPLLGERRRPVVRGQDRGLLSQDAVGRHGDQVLRLRQQSTLR